MSGIPWWLRSRRRPSAFLELTCAQRTVGVEAALRLPNVMMLVVEDACARIAEESWQRRGPRRWRLHAHRSWRQEGEQLREKRARMRDLAVECLDGRD
ncbi:hypothetical protein PV682_38195 [Streptomyces niveiscabiei]|uniref:hypothetical protein n=1 Tax=Streptomyces niveiscabiei TaxID=164115 RepID=UPI0029B2EA55|nr:hypothetical protein [Streptomyces niveiscabiei]MDX3387234.1 hypothetical protein [Streptomyces niveiscabiei]